MSDGGQVLFVQLEPTVLGPEIVKLLPAARGRPILASKSALGSECVGGSEVDAIRIAIADGIR